MSNSASQLRFSQRSEVYAEAVDNEQIQNAMVYDIDNLQMEDDYMSEQFKNRNDRSGAISSAADARWEESKTGGRMLNDEAGSRVLGSSPHPSLHELGNSQPTSLSSRRLRSGAMKTIKPPISKEKKSMFKRIFKIKKKNVLKEDINNNLMA